ncbi:MAG: maleylpyruvate isomerase family mycothiol-dependent enzyme [Actinomycetota bacterium]
MTTTQTDAMWAAIEVERLRLADDLAGLSEHQWTTQSQCDRWTVEEVAAHLVVPFEVSNLRLGLTMAKNRFSLTRTVNELTARLHASTSRAERIELLRANAADRWTPPGLGPEIPLSEVIVHGQDIRRPLGLDHSIPAATIDLALNGISDLDTRADYARRIHGSVVEPVADVA